MTPDDAIAELRWVAHQLRVEAGNVGAPTELVRRFANPDAWSGTKATQFFDELARNCQRVSGASGESVETQLFDMARRLDANADAAQQWLDAVVASTPAAT